MPRDSYRGMMVIPYKVTCFSSRCKSFVCAWTSSGERAEVSLLERGWKLKRGAWRCPKHRGEIVDVSDDGAEEGESSEVESGLADNSEGDAIGATSGRAKGSDGVAKGKRRTSLTVVT